MRRAIFFTSSCGTDKENEFESCRGEGRISINTAFGFSLLGYECYVVNAYKFSLPKKIWENVYIINKPDENVVYDIAFSWNLEHLIKTPNFKYKIITTYTDTPRLLKIIKEQNLDIILTCNVPCMMHESSHYNYQNTQYLPVIFPIPSVNIGFLPYKFEPKLPELNVLLYHSTWEHTIARSQYYIHKQQLIINTLNQKYKVNLNVLVANENVRKRIPLIYDLFKCNKITCIDNEKLRYNDIINLISSVDLCLPVGAIFMPGPLVVDILSLGKPIIYTLEGYPSKTEFNNNCLCKCSDYILIGPESDTVSIEKIEKLLKNLEISFNYYRKSIEDYDYKNWKKCTEEFLIKNCEYNTNVININDNIRKIDNMNDNITKDTTLENKFGDRIDWDHHVNEILTSLNEDANTIFYKKENEKIDKLKKYKDPETCTYKQKVLDCGCHIGRWIEVFRENNYDYTGVDQSKVALETALKYKPDGKFVHSLLWEMNFNNEFDIVHTNAVLQHNKLNEQEKILSRISKALKNDGILIIAESTVNRETETQRTYNGWIKCIENHGFKFLESWHKNELGLNDNYIFIKVNKNNENDKEGCTVVNQNVDKDTLEKLICSKPNYDNYTNHFKSKGLTTKEYTIDSLKSNIKNHSVFYCTICQHPEEALPNAQRVRPYVDEIIIVYNQPNVIEQVKSEFDGLGATLHYVDWKEDFSFKRTQYIRKSGEVALQKGYDKNKLWMLITDSDEFISKSVLQNLESIITKAELSKSTICTVNAHDYFIKGEGTANPFTFIPRPLEDIKKEEIIMESVSNYHKELLVKYQDRLEYKGKVHHTLHGSGLRTMQAPREYYYDHIKTDADLHPHGCRNWFIGGGGVQEFGEKWKLLRSITDKYGLDTWEKMEKVMKNGNIQQDIKQFFIDHKDDNDRHTDSELRSFYAFYNILHSREFINTTQTVKTVITKDRIVDPECASSDGKLYQFIESEYLRILGTNADPVKTTQFINDINCGKMKKEDVTSFLNSIKSGKDDWKKHATKKDELINTSEPLYPNPQKETGDYIKDLNYHFQDVKVDSYPSNVRNIETPKVETQKIESTKPETLNSIDIELNKISDEFKNKVIDAYIKILRRYPDDGGLLNYADKLRRGMSEHGLEKILKMSDEYKEKSAFFKQE